MSTSQKRNKAVESITEHPLSLVGILQQVLEFVGPGHCIFMAVSKLSWQSYKRVPDVKLEGLSSKSCDVEFVCTPYTTLLRAAIAFASRLRLACICGLQLSTWRAQRAVELVGDRYISQYLLHVSCQCRGQSM
jgi:hypothetical protein